ncbi:MAG: hypothetical protein ISS69_03450 [Phycisphaerae bacterium]|nr:hypothetical protein [Planctomycetota bacterium]MBL7219145.1 hypothetical protein [Phycisphaerae bacterium]
MMNDENDNGGGREMGTGEFPHVLIDTNYWKSFVHARLMYSVVCTTPGPREVQKLLNPPDEIRSVLGWGQVFFTKEVIVLLEDYTQLIVGAGDNWTPVFSTKSP